MAKKQKNNLSQKIGKYGSFHTSSPQHRKSKQTFFVIVGFACTASLCRLVQTVFTVIYRKEMDTGRFTLTNPK